MHLVAHVERLRDQRLDLNAVALRESHLQHAVQGGRHPGQALDDFGSVGAEPQHFPQSFVQITESLASGRGIAHDPHRHGWTDDTGHRSDRAMVMARRKRNLAARREPLGRRVTLRPALENDGADDSALHRAAHLLPRNRRSGMQNPPLIHPDNGFAGERNSYKRRIGAEISGKSLLVRRLDFFVVDEAGQRLAGCPIAASRRCPSNSRRLAAGLHDLVGE